MASSAAGPSGYDPNDRIDPDIIDPDDLTINDLDDPLDSSHPASSTTHLNPLTRDHLTTRIGGQDRRAPHDTLDESVWSTLSRDLHSIYLKLLSVLYPKYLISRKWPDAQSVLESGGVDHPHQSVHEWDLWGPLLFALTLSTLLSLSASPPTDEKEKDKNSQASDIFAGTFVLIWLGEAVVTLQIKLLGGTIGFFQSVSVIGYTLFPLSIAALLSALGLPVVVRVPVYAVLWIWSLLAGVSILGGSGVVRNRVALAVYPLGVFYTALVVLCLVS